MTAVPASRSLPAPRRRHRVTPAAALVAFAVLAALVLALPLATVVGSIGAAGEGAWAHLARTVLWGYVGNSAGLMLIVGAGTLLLGTATAWLVSLCEFPGRRAVEWALVMPLTLPAYVVAYAYTDLLQHSGPVQSLLRDLTGWGPRDYWFPNIRSLGGAGFVFTMVFYPYVYLLGRAAFLRQSGPAFEAARLLGETPWGAFRRVAVPMARPALVAGCAIALMETLADYGAVAHFGVPTFTTGIYRAWFAMGDRTAAVQLAACLVGMVLLLVVLERLERRRVPEASSPRGARDLTRMPLRGWAGAGALALCLLPLLLGFAVPLGALAALALPRLDMLAEPRLLGLVVNTVQLATVSALVAVALGLLLAYAARLRPGLTTGTANRVAALGYALPGSIVAVGLLLPLAGFDNALDGLMRERFGISTGLLLTGSITALVYAYTVRFMAISLGTIEASLAKVTPSLDGAARVLGASPAETLRRVHVPMIGGGLLTAALLVFVEVAKELPATLIVRPFNYDTLAVQAHRLASDERLAEAAVPSLVIVAVSLLPVLVLTRQISRTAMHR